MVEMTRNDSRPVYSTETGRICPACSKAVAQCLCHVKTAPPTGAGPVRVSTETRGRRGKAVTLITGLALDLPALTELGKQLRTRFGTGGTVKEGLIELQGDHGDAVIERLKLLGHQVKRAGG